MVSEGGRTVPIFHLNPYNRKLTPNIHLHRDWPAVLLRRFELPHPNNLNGFFIATQPESTLHTNIMYSRIWTNNHL